MTPIATVERGTIRIRVNFTQPPKDVWEVLTAPRHIVQWWGRYVEFTPGPGGTLTEKWTNEAGRLVTTSGSVTQWRAPTVLELTWRDDDWAHGTVVRFTLASHGSGCDLTLEHSGWNAFPAPQRDALTAAHLAGWQHHLGNLRKHADAHPLR